MAKTKVDLPTWILIGAVVFIAYTLSASTPVTPNGDTGGVNLCAVVDASY